MRVALVFDRHRDDTVGIYFERACRTLGLAVDHFWLREGRAIPAGYDLYLRIDHGDYCSDLPDRLRPKMFYAVDTHLPKSWARIRRMAGRYDLVCCAQRRAAESLSNGIWVPLACDPDVHRRVEQPRRWDVAFVGSDGGVPRKFYVQALRERYPRSSIGHAAYAELGAIYSRAAVGFNYGIRDDVNMRVFEILSSGALLVTNRVAHDEYARLGLMDRQHLVVYRRPAEMFEVIDYYLAHDAERAAIAARGHAAAVARHTYVHRLQRILRSAAERLGVPWQTDRVALAAKELETHGLTQG